MKGDKMNILKFNSKIEDYRYILSFDLAKIKTGYSLLDTKTNQIVMIGIINTAIYNDKNSFWLDFVADILEVFRSAANIAEQTDGKFFVIKERLPAQAGIKSTIATLQELAKIHGIFDYTVQMSGTDCYDWNGVHSVSVKSYFKHLLEIDKPQKEDIANKIYQLFPDTDFSDFTYDVTDSIAVTLTLLNSKWNKDIEEEIKETKKELKKFKSEKKIQELNEKIEFLNTLRR